MHLGCAKGLEVRGDELGVEQPEPAGLESCDEMHQRDFRRIAGTVKHALAEEGAAEAHAVKPAHQLLSVINLDGMAMANVIELAVERADTRVDPGARPARA